MDLSAAVAAVVDELSAAGIRATADERDLNPPAVYVSPRRMDLNKLAGYSMTLAVYAVVPNTGRLTSLDALGPLVDQVRDVWGVTGGTFEDLTPLDAGDPLPAVRFDLSVTVEE